MGIILNPELERRIAEKVKSGCYGSADELIERSLDLLEERVGTVNGAQSKDAPAEPDEPIWETLMRLGRQVPDEEWARVPADLSRNLEHYLYGAPKESE